MAEVEFQGSSRRPLSPSPRNLDYVIGMIALKRPEPAESSVLLCFCCHKQVPFHQFKIYQNKPKHHITVLGRAHNTLAAYQERLPSTPTMTLHPPTYTRTNAPTPTPSGSHTVTSTTPPPDAQQGGHQVKVLRLRGGPVSRRRVVWDEDVVDNEHMGKKSSKSECWSS